MSTEVFLILFAVGIGAGLLSGLFGVGGGIVIVPSLIAVYSFVGFQTPYSVHIAVATSLFTIVFTSTSSAYKHSAHNNVLWAAAVLIGLASSVTVFLFSKLALSLPGDVLKKIFSFILIAVGIKMILEKKNSRNGEEENCETGKMKKSFCLMLGVVAGMIAAFTGLGGGVFVIPLLHYFLKVPIKKAIGTSVAAIFITSLAGVISYFINTPPGANTLEYSVGMVDTVSAIPIIIASIPFAQAGVYLNKKSNTNMLKKLFAGLVFIVSVKMLFF